MTSPTQRSKAALVADGWTVAIVERWKPIVGKPYKGDSPNPTYIIKKLTGAFGPIGGKWGFNVKFDRTRLGLPHQVVTRQHVVMSPDKDESGDRATLEKTVEYALIREEHHEVCITFWFRDENGEVGTFDAYGGTPMLYMAKSGRWMHDEDAAKKSLTDAYTKGASWLGACADIFLGLFDDKYTSQPEGSIAPQGDTPKPDKTPPHRRATAPAPPLTTTDGADCPALLFISPERNITWQTEAMTTPIRACSSSPMTINTCSARASSTSRGAKAASWWCANA